MAEILWKTRSLVDADFEKASQLRKIFFAGESGSSRRSSGPIYYRWKILTNPVGSGLFHVADHAGQVVGMTTITPKRLCLRGEVIQGAEIGDTFTHPQYQRQGMFSALVNMTREKALECGLEFIYGTPNIQSLPGYEKKLDFGQIPSAQVYNYVRPMNVTAVLATRFGRPRFAKALGSIAGPGFEALFRFRRPRLRDVIISSASSFPDEVGELWRKVAQEYDWILKRDKNYLAWRFVHNPDEYSIWLARRSEKTIGYLVVKLGQFSGLTVGYLADFVVEEESPEVFTALLYNAVRLLRTTGCDMLSAWSVRGSVYQKVLSRFGFFRYAPVPIICYKNDLGLQFIHGHNKWHFTMADSDNI